MNPRVIRLDFSCESSFQVNRLLGRGFTRKIKPYFLRKIKVKKIKCRLLQVLFGALRVKQLAERTHKAPHVSPLF